MGVHGVLPRTLEDVSRHFLHGALAHVLDLQFLVDAVLGGDDLQGSEDWLSRSMLDATHNGVAKLTAEAQTVLVGLLKQRSLSDKERQSQNEAFHRIIILM